MSINSSSSSLSVSPPLLPSSNSSVIPFYLSCPLTEVRRAIFNTYTFIGLLLLLPLYILVLYLAVQRWRNQRSAASGMTMRTMSHTDFFTCNMMIPEIICVVGSFFFMVGRYADSEPLLQLGLFLFSIILPGQTLFHVLTCLERYLAVAHPMAYRYRRQTYGLRIRSISVVWVWLLCFGWVGVMKMYLPQFPTVPFFSFLAVCILIILFCCLSVLCALTHPGPGDGQVDQSRQRAFNMMLAVTVTLLLRFVGLLVCYGLKHGVQIDLSRFCELLDTGILLTLPSNLVLPLLFLHRAGKLSCFRRSAGSG